MFNYGNANEAQKEAISATDGLVLITAGPGTGKTFTLVKRAVYLIQECGIKPEQIMMATFTEKAAKELITRITNELAERNVSVNVTQNYTGTPYVKKQVLPEVVYAYGLNESIAHGYLKDADPIGFENVKSEVFLRTSITKFWERYGGKTYEGLLPKLQEFGMDIVTIHSTQSKYFVASRKFELPELKLLIDAVESSKFITKKKSETLIEKIHTMTSPGQVAKLKRNNYVVNRIKPDNEQIYYIIDAINDAINAGKQISFQYYDYTGLKKKVLKNKGEVYKLSPYKLLWCGDYYYVLGYSEKKSKVINFRVDRIASKPEILDKDIIPMPDDFDIENYTKEVFFMFSGEKVLVDLRCDNSLMKTMVDRFGEDVTTLAYDMTSFRVQTEVSASPTFFGWVFGFNGKVQILAPESVKEQYRQMIAKADEDMQESE